MESCNETQKIRGRLMLESSSKCDQLCDKDEQTRCHEEMLKQEKTEAKRKVTLAGMTYYDREVLGQSCARGNCE